MTRSRADWHAYAARLTIRDQAFIDGEFTASRSGQTLPTIDPATGTIIADVAACSQADVDRAVTAARRSFDDGRWSRSASAERRRVLLRLAGLIEDHADEFAVLDSRDTGKPVRDARLADVPAAVGTFAFYAEAVDKI